MQTVYKLEVQRDPGGPLNDFFRASELAELPPKLRAVFEENKVSTLHAARMCQPGSSCSWDCNQQLEGCNRQQGPTHAWHISHLCDVLMCAPQTMKEKLRKYKARTAQLEHQVSQKNSQVVVLEDTIASLKQQLSVRGGQCGLELAGAGAVPRVGAACFACHGCWGCTCTLQTFAGRHNTVCTA